MWLCRLVNFFNFLKMLCDLKVLKNYILVYFVFIIDRNFDMNFDLKKFDEW